MARTRILFVFGTRPEAIKLAPVIRAVRAQGLMTPRVCVTAQHREMLDQALDIFRLKPHHDLDIMRDNQSLQGLTIDALKALGPVIDSERPSMVVVQGDTTTTFVAALAAFYAKVPVAHVEAGLRTGDMYNPFPEEINRAMVTRLSTLHFAPTRLAMEKLLAEGVDRKAVRVTGNTVVDALRYVLRGITPGAARSIQRSLGFGIENSAPLVLVTAHRRESFGKGLENICDAMVEIAGRFPEATMLYPVHLNPNIRATVNKRLSGTPNIRLLEPVDYRSFVYLMSRADLLITDSGGIQEEGSALGKPVVVMRKVTERMEAVLDGNAVLAGTSRRSIVREATRVLSSGKDFSGKLRKSTSYGRGRASEAIVGAIARHLKLKH